ncbi:MAG: hypothetical protein ACOH2Q_22065 [Rhodococcus sp. (in: high G+C Gram-positive bacteria)]
MTPVVVGAAGVIALILLTSTGSGLDFNRRSLSAAYASGPVSARRRLSGLRSAR